MNCKYCNEELEEGISVCPACGKDNAAEEAAPAEALPSEEETVADVTEVLAEETPSEEAEVSGEETVPEETDGLEEVTEAPEEDVVPAKKRSPWKIGLAIGGCVVLLAVLAAVIVVGLNGGFKPRENNVSYKDNYSVSDEKVQKNGDVVIATVGDKELTIGELQVHYWMQVYQFLEDNSYYLSYYGLDYTKPLNEQYVSEEDGMTWQHYFLESALGSWQRHAVLNILGEENGYEMSAELKESLEKLPANLETTATSNKFANATEMLRSDMGAGCDVDDYMSYINLYYYGLEYYNSVCEAQMPTDADIEAYYTEHEADIKTAGYSKEDGNQVNVRHILIEPEGGTEDDDGKVTYSEDEWEACRVAAQALLDEWKAGDATEDSFAEMANEHSADGGSNTNGGLYQNVNKNTDFVEPFLTWCMDESRKVGDTGLVKTDYGYHIMYMSSMEEMWTYYCRNSIITDTVNDLMNAGIEKYPIDTNYKSIVLGVVDFNG